MLHFLPKITYVKFVEPLFEEFGAKKAIN